MVKDVLWPLMIKNVTPAATRKMSIDIGSYVDRNSGILLTLDLSNRYSFADGDRELIYNVVGTSENEVSELVAGSKQIYQSNRVQSNPFYITCALLTGWYLNKKDAQSANVVWTYMSLMMLTSIHKGLFKFGLNHEVWEYTLAHLDKTFSIREFPSIFAFIQDNTKTVVDTYKAKLMKGDDKDLAYTIDANWTRLKGKLKKLAARYYDNHKSGRYLNQDTDSYDSEDFHMMDNVSFATDRLVNRVYIKLINRQFDRRFIKYSMNGSETSYTKVSNLVDDIIDNDGESGTMRSLIDNLVRFYLLNSGRPISYVGKGDFIAYMKTAFGSNTTAGEMATIKNIIDQWLADNMYKYGRANYGKTVQIMYRRVIYMFFVFVINYEAKLQ